MTVGADAGSAASLDLSVAGGRAPRDKPESQGDQLVGLPGIGGMELRGGGAVAVDTETLRLTARAFDRAAAELDGLRDRLGSVQNMLLVERDTAWAAASAVSVVSTRAADAVAEAGLIADQLRGAACVYELVELNAEHTAALLAGDAEAMARIDARRATLMDGSPEAMARAREFEFWRSVNWPGPLVRQGTEAGYGAGGLWSETASAIAGVAVGGVLVAGAATAGIGGWGRVPRDERLTGMSEPITLQRVATKTTDAVPPTSLAGAAGRIPQGTAAQVRVERYTMPDGSRQFAVYVTGMRSGAVGGAEPWDMRSNVQLYAGERSSSYEATLAALESAGAEPGDVVHAFGHSQGAMITEHLALEGGYDTRTTVSFGSPVEADVGAGTLHVAVRHTDDPVAALAGGGHLSAVGAPGSFTAEREAHPTVDAADAGLPGHTMAGYTETAAMVDATTDPRMTAVRALFDELGTATDVEVLEFAATRVEAVSPSAPGGG